MHKTMILAAIFLAAAMMPAHAETAALCDLAMIAQDDPNNVTPSGGIVQSSEFLDSGFVFNVESEGKNRCVVQIFTGSDEPCEDGSYVEFSGNAQFEKGRNITWVEDPEYFECEGN